MLTDYMIWAPNYTLTHYTYLLHTCDLQLLKTRRQFFLVGLHRCFFNSKQAVSVKHLPSQYLDVEVLPEGRVVDSGMVHNAQTVPFATLACPHLAGPCLQPSSTPLIVNEGDRKKAGGVGGGHTQVCGLAQALLKGIVTVFDDALFAVGKQQQTHASQKQDFSIIVECCSFAQTNKTASGGHPT